MINYLTYNGELVFYPWGFNLVHFLIQNRDYVEDVYFREF